MRSPLLSFLTDVSNIDDRHHLEHSSVSTDTNVKLSLSRTSALAGLVVLMLLVALPSAIRRIIETGNPYLFTEQFFGDLFARLEGPGRLWFTIQPPVAIVLGARDGLGDMRAGYPPFASAMLSRRSARLSSWGSAFLSLRDLVMIAIILDIISQFLMFRDLHPGAAQLLKSAVIAAPHTISGSVTSLVGKGRIKRPFPAGPG